MPSFLVNQDLFDRYGTKNVTAWSDLAGGTVLDQTRMDNAMDYGEAKVQNQFRRSGYQVPFSFTSSPKDREVVDWMVIYASEWLYSSRDVRNRSTDNSNDIDRFQKRIKVMENSIARVLAGRMDVQLARTTNPNPTAPECIF